MTVLNLLVKVFRVSQLGQIENFLADAFENLNAVAKVLGNSVNNWVQISLSGEDEAIATSYISKEIGICPASLENAKVSSILKGYITTVSEKKAALIVDVGIFKPRPLDVFVPVACLRSALVDGQDVPLKKIAELYGLAEDLPVSVKLVREDELGNLQAELSIEQVKRLRGWQESLLDRLIILGSSRGDVETVLERTRLNRDVISIESLGLFEHALMCKLGTDAAGLIPKVGRYMRHAKFLVFNPLRLMPEFLG